MVSRRRGRVVLAAALGFTLTIALALAAGGAVAGARATHAHHAPTLHGAAAHDEASATSRRALHDEMRKLWEDHVTWTRLFIVSFAEDLPDLSATTDRLLANQVDIGDAIRPFYGDEAGDRLTALLTGHITTAADVLGAAKSGDDEAFAAAHDEWYRNARRISRFLSAANPDHWPLDEMKTMMRDHLDLTLAEAAHRLAGDYVQEVADYDAVHDEILHMADMLSHGIVRQFPDRFA